MRLLSVAVIGAGNMAGGYDENKRTGDLGIYSHAGAYAAHGGFNLKSVFDPDRERAEAFRNIWKADRVADDQAEIQRTFHDVVSICSPDATHFEAARAVLQSRCCRTLFVEKPLATNLDHIDELIRLAQQSDIHLVVNFQRRYEPVHSEIRDLITSRSGTVLSVTGHYMKGLRHVGTTMVDTLTYLCGYPDAVLAYARAYNQEAEEFSYEFVMYYPGYSVAVKTTDADRLLYHYHVFEIDLLLTDRRLTLAANSLWLRETAVTDYFYTGVKALNDRGARFRETDYKASMVEAARYVYDITTGRRAHDINTPGTSYNDCLVIDQIVESYARGSAKLSLGSSRWKR
jgi:predicted dehydrogenase